jgi:hypothetical protein
MADPTSRNAAADAAIALVLGTEREARTSIERARAEAPQIAENARTAARCTMERTERRIRCVVAAFERELATHLAGIDAEIAALEQAQPIGADEHAALARALAALARQIVGVQP